MKTSLKLILIQYWPRLYMMSLEHLKVSDESETISILSNDSEANLMRITLNKVRQFEYQLRITIAKDLNT